jgi:uncharacterized tellurite resistance protein B-like protein
VKSCIKEEMDISLRGKLQNYLLKEMDTHFKRMEDNVVRRIREEMISLTMSKIVQPRASDGNTDRETEV